MCVSWEDHVTGSAFEQEQRSLSYLYAFLLLWANSLVFLTKGTEKGLFTIKYFLSDLPFSGNSQMLKYKV